MGSYNSKVDASSRNVRLNNCADELMTNTAFSIPDDLLIDVLSFVPSFDLIHHCQLVCKSWKEIIDGHGLWKIKCQREKKYIPRLKFEKIPLHFYRFIYLHNPYGTNLINNPCGENDLNNWAIILNGGDGFVVEDPPNGANPVPAEVASTKCFSTSYFPNQKHQLIDLFARGIQPEVMDSSKTKIEVGEWYAARFDCSSVYKLAVFLLDEKFNQNSSSQQLQYCTVDKFEFEYREEQWVGKEWHKVNHVFDNVCRTRYILFQHYGKDCQFWAGHFGSKMTGAFVKVIV